MLLLICEIEIFMLIVGCWLVLKRLDCRKIWLLVIEIMLVGMYVEMLFVLVLMIGRFVMELVLSLLDSFV